MDRRVTVAFPVARESGVQRQYRSSSRTAGSTMEVAVTPMAIPPKPHLRNSSSSVWAEGCCEVEHRSFVQIKEDASTKYGIDPELVVLVRAGCVNNLQLPRLSYR